jgi:hypothetical protein
MAFALLQRLKIAPIGRKPRPSEEEPTPANRAIKNEPPRLGEPALMRLPRRTCPDCNIPAALGHSYILRS